MGFRYDRLAIKKTTEGRSYTGNVIYPDIPISEDDFYVISTGGDRFDILAQQFYQDSSLWWIISSANPVYGGSLAIPTGTQLRIPASKSKALQLFEEVNQNR